MTVSSPAVNANISTKQKSEGVQRFEKGAAAKSRPARKSALYWLYVELVTYPAAQAIKLKYLKLTM